MFIEDEDIEQAANVEQPEVEQPTSPVEPVDQTKAFAARLKEEKAKAKQETREEIAKEFGYASWKEYSDAQTNNKLLDKGIDPDLVLPVLKDLIREDPEFKDAKTKAEKYEELEKELFAANSIKALNERFGTTFKSINELDAETINLWNSGMSLDKAYAANNWQTIADLAVKQSGRTADNGKSHLKTVDGSGEASKNREVTQAQLAAFRAFGISEDKARAYLDKQSTKK